MSTLPVAAAEEVLERNLAALARTSPRAAELVRVNGGLFDITFHETEQGVLSATVGEGAWARQLASRRRPLDEADRLAAPVDVASKPAVVVLGFGMGYHVAALARRIRRTGLIVVFEPDVALLRSVLERVDHSEWLRASNVVVLTDADDAGAMARSLTGVEGLVAMGVALVEHGASRARLGDLGTRFGARFMEVVRSLSTAITTTMVQVGVTVRNLTQNLDRYGTSGGVAELAGVLRGRAAVLVAAGPSLERNVAELARPGVRDRFVLIAAQTVLRPLLARGVRPHFVTALDYHEISRRFYEGLTGADVEGITLIVEPKANPAILGAWPGRVRCVGDGVLDTLLGPLARPMGRIPAGATVAHLSYYLARHLGCDPVVLVGQDLGFTDGQYYAAGAAIHDVWAAELGPFRTLEMFEWERIARGRRVLRPATDVLGRPIYTDEQMAAYLLQFERDFGPDSARGLRILDATEGGVRKAHTEPVRLADALRECAPPAGAPAIDALLVACPDGPEPLGVPAMLERVRGVRRDVWEVARLSRQAADLLGRMAAAQDDQALVNELIDRVHAVRDTVRGLEPAYTLVHHLNQTGSFNRIRADRELELEAPADPMETQRREIARDLRNVRWLAESADELGRMLDDAARALRGEPKRTRDVTPDEGAGRGEAGPAGSAGAVRGGRAGASGGRARVWGLVPLLPHGGVGTPRDPLAVLDRTLARLARCRGLDGVALLPAPGVDAGRWARGAAGGLRVRVLPLGEGEAPSRRVRAARAFNPGAWRGGLGAATVFDEVLIAGAMARALAELGGDGALLAGPDWCVVDPALCDGVIERYRERPDGTRLAFTQAAPGLCGCVLARSLLEELARLDAQDPARATVGALLGYLPSAPSADLIARLPCVPVTPAARDAGARLIADTPACAGILGRDADAGVAGDALDALGPGHLVLELTARRLRPLPESPGRADLPLELALGCVRELAALRPDAALTLGGAGDPMLHPRVCEVVRGAREAGVAAVHVRTDALCAPEACDALLDAGVDIVSVDLLGEEPGLYLSIAGIDGYETVRANVERMLARAGRAGAWVVPRITRCDASYESIEPFYDRWLMRAGAAVIDPAGAWARTPEDRIAPLPLPRLAHRRGWSTRLRVRSDGCVPFGELDEGAPGGAGVAGRAGAEPLAALWARVLARRRELHRADPFHPGLETGV